MVYMEWRECIKALAVPFISSHILLFALLLWHSWLTGTIIAFKWHLERDFNGFYYKYIHNIS